MIISILHWHVFTVALSTIPNYIGICLCLGAPYFTHTTENLPIHPDDSAFSQQFAGSPRDGAIPSTSRSVLDLPDATVIHK